ncbi:protein TORNADO 1 [Ananas comosus]|uniref:Protein TORNADO 1 n=2 Tax=Ananas comosus TaxID=4615 RepID=A0A6P5G424_ANACO|nr:protein TORNADO 1 [Ananas comosus]
MGDLLWALQIIQSGDTELESISFYQTQSTSNSYQETEKSVSINIARNDISTQFFSRFLNELAMQRGNWKSLTNLSFHGVEWQQQLQLQILCTWLSSSNSGVKQLEFQKNTFGVEDYPKLSEMLKRNTTIKAIIFSECNLQSTGARHLASALAENDTVEELQIWEDSVGSEGAEELSRMIEMNYALKLLLILDKDPVTATPLISATIARNRTTELHIWGGESTDSKRFKVVEFMPETSTLRIYKINSSGSRRVACALGWNITVATLDMTGIPLQSKWAKEFAGALEQNKSLKKVKLSRTCLKDKAIVYIGAGLFKNKSLENLWVDGNWFGGVGVEHLLCPISRFSPLQSQANNTLKSLTFGGGKTRIGRCGITAILRLLETNQSMVQLVICEDRSMKPNDIARIFRSLERNATIRFLSLTGCTGVEGDVVLQTIMETLQVNPWIEEIDLSGTPLQIAGKADGIYEKLIQNGAPIPENDLLTDLPQTMPTCCRLFLCGQELAGKTTLCNSIYHNMNATDSQYMDRIRSLIEPVEKIAGAPDIKIRTIHDGDMTISIWNLAGQHENCALQDLMFPGHGSPSFFLIISSLFRKPANRDPKSPTEIEEDLLYWLKFIVSSSRRTLSRMLLPHVSVVLTHSDKVCHLSGDLHSTVAAIQRLREDFRDYIDFYPTVFSVDARSSTSVSKLTHHIRKISRTIVQRAPQVYRFCNDLINHLNDWRSRNYGKPIMRWNEFCDLCQLKVPAVRIRSRHDNMEKLNNQRHALASSLHNMGQIIFFGDLGFLILDCEWFFRNVLSQLTNLDAIRITQNEKNGFISRKELEKVIRLRLQNQVLTTGPKVFDNLEINDLINMMLKLELCHEQDPGDPNTLLLVPGILQETRGRTQKWQLSTPGCVYVGRHLECDDSKHMFLTNSFFAKLQVHLYNKILRSTNQQGATYNLEKYLIYVVINGIHLRVELGGQLGHHIDILACSTKTISEILRVFHQLIIPTILSLCPSITFIESIIRPECVKHLIPPRFRRAQHVPLQHLKQILLSLPADSMYDYQHTWSSVENDCKLILKSASDYGRDLLSDEDIREVLHRRYYDLHHLAIELALPQDKLHERENNVAAVDVNSHELDTIEPSILGIAKGVEIVLQRLKTIEQGIKDLKQEIQGLRYYEYHLLTELHNKVDYLVNYNIELQERKVPNMFYFVQVQDYSKRLITRLFSGMAALRLHMLCEFRREMHVVDDQIGCGLIQVDNQTVKCLLPYMSKFMKLLTFALKIGAHFVAGMGEMIPDLSREVAHLLDPSLVYGATAVTAGALGAVMIGKVGGNRLRRRNFDNSTGDIAQDMKAARQWLADFLKGQRITTGTDIAERFGLWRVRYTDSGQIAWICRRHITMRGNEVIGVPL